MGSVRRAKKAGNQTRDQLGQILLKQGKGDITSTKIVMNFQRQKCIANYLILLIHDIYKSVVLSAYRKVVWNIHEYVRGQSQVQ